MKFKKIIFSALLASGLALAGAGLISCQGGTDTTESETTTTTENTQPSDNQQAGSQDQAVQIRGEITEIGESGIKIESEDGGTHLVMADQAKKLQGFEVGDMVEIEMDNGKILNVREIQKKTQTGSQEKSHKQSRR